MNGSWEKAQGDVDLQRSESIHTLQKVPPTPAAVVRLAEAEAFILMVRGLGLTEDLSIDILTELKRKGIVVQFV
jgi:hypothetical protein